ncbi:MAG: ribonuclease Z [Firmicutes bacterium]|nr:ribonuclease Z [Bacillota bacterium]
MELNFLGRGSAFNSKEGNTSAYFIENKELFLIDCGEAVFERIIKNDVVKDIEQINVLITHTHSDHIGSLGSLIMYSYYIMKEKVNIIIPTNAKYIENIEMLLKAVGCTNDMYNYVVEDSFDNKYDIFSNIRFIETRHSDNLNCYGIVFATENGIIYYSGDTNDIDVIRSILKKNYKIDKLYIETTLLNYEGNVHLYIGFLDEVINEELKKQVYCMHVESDECIKRVRELGFNVVDIK